MANHLFYIHPKRERGYTWLMSREQHLFMLKFNSCLHCLWSKNKKLIFFFFVTEVSGFGG